MSSDLRRKMAKLKRVKKKKQVKKQVKKRVKKPTKAPTKAPVKEKTEKRTRIKAELNKGIKRTMPELARIADSVRNVLIAKYGLKQALTVSRLVQQKVLAVKNVQDKRDKGEIGGKQ